MTDYETMYHTLFNKITDIVEDLQQVQQQTEEMYINYEEEINKFSNSDSKKRNGIFAIPQK